MDGTLKLGPIFQPRSGATPLVEVVSSGLLERRSMASHERVSSGKEEWLTPKEITDVLGPFDLDPCSPIVRPWSTAKTHYTIKDDGLKQLWHGRVWLNPPYGNETEKWMARMAQHNDGISLIFARTETATWFDSVWPVAAGCCSLKAASRSVTLTGEELAPLRVPRRASSPTGKQTPSGLKRAAFRGALWRSNTDSQTKVSY